MNNFTKIDPDLRVHPIWNEVRVLLASVHYGPIHLASHAESMFAFMAVASPLIAAGRIMVKREYQQPLDWSRSRLAWEAMQVENGFTHLFFFDTDMSVSLADIEALLLRQQPIVSGTYFMGAHKMRLGEGGEMVVAEAFPCVASRGHKYITRSEIVEATAKGSLIEVESVGCGCLLVTAEALRTIGAPAFKHNWTVQGHISDIEYEDGWFSRQARSAGIPIHMDPTVRPVHYKMARIGFHIEDQNGNRIVTPQT